MSKEYEEKRGPRGADDHTEKRFPRERRVEERVPMRERDAEADGLIEGRNAVTEALRAGTVLTNLRVIQRPGKDDPNRRFNTLESYRVASAA